MSYSSRGPGGSYGAAGAAGAGDGFQQDQPAKGSVRAMRERLMAAQQPAGRPSPAAGYSQHPPPIRENPLKSQYSTAKTQAPRPAQRSIPILRVLESDGTPQEQPPATQRPLRPEAAATASTAAAGAASRAAPPRPLRPPNPPTFLDSPRSAENIDDAFLSPTSFTSPNPSRQTSSSIGSTASSLGSIPDFPVAVSSLPPPRRSPNLGPPPSSRRGPSSYYSQASYVAPIAEEAELRASKGSFASSNVIPTGVPGFFQEDGEGDTMSEDEGAVPASSNARPAQPTTLVRQASLGKRGRATLTNVKPTENSTPNEKAGNVPSSQGPDRQVMSSTPGAHSLASGRSVLLDASSSPSSSEEDLEKVILQKEMMFHKAKSPSKGSLGGTPFEAAAAKPPRSFRPSSRKGSQPALVVPPAVQSSVDQILGGLEKAGTLDSGSAGGGMRQIPKSSLADRSGTRRPARINVDAVREAEARGSLTSLPDLIRRATRLASNLDRGKTASRLGTDWGFDDLGRERMGKEAFPTLHATHGSGGSLADMISAFPNPANVSPDRGTTPTGGGTLSASAPSSQRQLNGRSHRHRRKRGRRCCGLPLWGFIVLVLFLFVLVAAAVLVPVVLIVLPRKHHSTNTSTNQRAQCEAQNPCENGGTVTVLADGTCSCVCTNGFTGPRCLNTADAGCTSSTMGGTKNATMGTQIASLLAEANSKYSIPLDGSTILSLFAQSNFTCSAQNALVTFAGLPGSKRHLVRTVEQETEAIVVTRVTEELRRRGDPIISTGLLIDFSSAPSSPADSTTASATAPAVPSPTTTGSYSPTGSSSAPSSTPTSAPVGTNSTSQDFAKVGILFVLQESLNLSVAIEAQQRIESFLVFAVKSNPGAAEASNVSLGSGFAINLVDLTVTLKNGTVFGDGFNGTATSIAGKKDTKPGGLHWLSSFTT